MSAPESQSTVIILTLPSVMSPNSVQQIGVSRQVEKRARKRAVHMMLTAVKHSELKREGTYELKGLMSPQPSAMKVLIDGKSLVRAGDFLLCFRSGSDRIVRIKSLN